jgi:hypothetical protein
MIWILPLSVALILPGKVVASVVIDHPSLIRVPVE